MYSVRGKDGEQNGTICSGTYLGREKGIFLDPGSPELADGAASVKIYRVEQVQKNTLAEDTLCIVHCRSWTD